MHFNAVIKDNFSYNPNIVDVKSEQDPEIGTKASPYNCLVDKTMSKYCAQ